MILLMLPSLIFFFFFCVFSIFLFVLWTQFWKPISVAQVYMYVWFELLTCLYYGLLRKWLFGNLFLVEWLGHLYRIPSWFHWGVVRFGGPMVDMVVLYEAFNWFNHWDSVFFLVFRCFVLFFVVCFCGFLFRSVQWMVMRGAAERPL